MIWFLYLPLALLLYVAVWQQHTQGPLYAALERQWPNPNSRRTTPVHNTVTASADTGIIDADPLIGELEDRPHVTDVPNAPVLERAGDGIDDGFNVYIDAGLAMSPNGHHAIKVVLHGNGTLTAAQAHRLHLVSDKAAQWVQGLRQDPGYTS